MYLRLFILLLSSLVAQAADETPRTCRILFLNAPADGPEKLHLFDGISSQEVELTRMSFSPVYKIPSGDLTLALLTNPPVPKAGEDLVMPPNAPQAALAAAISDFYLIVTSDPKNKIAPVKFQIVSANAKSFKPGQQLWFNLTENTIGGVLGTQKLLIKPQSRNIIDAPVSKQEEYHVKIQFKSPDNQRVEPLCETNWSHDPQNRSVFFVIDDGSLLPRILGIPDFRSKEDSNP